MQGRDQLLPELLIAVNAFQSKLKLFQKQLSTGNMIQVKSTFLFLEKTRADLVPDFEKYAIMCGDLSENFSKRFQNLNGRKTQINLFQRRFSVDVEYIDDADTQLELLDLRSNQILHDVFQQNSLLEFYSPLDEEKYPVLLRNAKIWICRFASTYSCEQAFSIMKTNKSQLRTRLTDGTFEFSDAYCYFSFEAQHFKFGPSKTSSKQ